ncbi:MULTISPECIES: glycoside hydrolase family 97 protein [Bacteroidales]|uniref:glycoside hydrolase family 97 protein n=1 Tax=Bacteroidales TaxID=171549 RepID=UPI0005734954|nr:glycoside hydrolase family 97 protein [Gabonia massiliensis]KHM45680.1 alpha-glucosidase [Coprobacter secundus]
MKRFILLCVVFFSFCSVGMYGKNVELKSPDGSLIVDIQLKDKIYYSIYAGSELLLKDCSMSLDLKDEVLGRSPKLRNIKRNSVDETVKREIPLKNAEVRNHYNVLRMDMAGDYSVEFRAYDNGVAYRFITNKKGKREVLDEEYSINFPDSYLAHLSQTESFKTSCEVPYTHVKTTEYKNVDQMSYFPVLLETNNGYNILISEADLYDYPCMFIKSSGNNGFRSVFPKCPLEFGEDGDRSVKILREADYIAKTSGSRNFPWRFFVISNDVRDIVSNEMVYNLSSPCELVDYSWIKPGQVSWEWWSGATPYGPDVNFVSGYNLDTYKYFIDFAARYGIPYILMDEGWALSTQDPYTPNPQVNVHEIVRYGKEKGVGVLLWLTWLTVEKHFDLFKTFSEWGISGIKIDFMDRSDQWMVNFYERVVKAAAENHLVIDFHGAFKPAGLERRYPNLLSYEGVRGMEYMGNCIPENSLYFPFIRNAVGPMDYTPGAMISMQPESYKAERPNAASIGTRAYQLALYVVFESAIQMLADNPTLYYRNQDCTEFITSVPVTWDKTEVLDAKVGEYVVIARNKNGKWYVGAICNGKETRRELTIDFSFLKGSKEYRMTSFEDGINAGNQAMDYRKKESIVKSGDKIKIELARNGGWAAVLE